MLPKALHERLAGEIAVSLKDNNDAILARALEVEQAIERRVEAERVTALFDAALGHGPGVLGLDDTLEAIVERRVRILVMEEDFRQPGFECPQLPVSGGERNGTLPTLRHPRSIRSWTSSSVRLNGRSTRRRRSRSYAVRHATH